MHWYSLVRASFVTMATKVCEICGQEKAIDGNFDVVAGYCSVKCEECVTAMRGEIKAAKKAARKQKAEAKHAAAAAANGAPPDRKVCCRCKESKLLKSFSDCRAKCTSCRNLEQHNRGLVKVAAKPDEFKMCLGSGTACRISAFDSGNKTCCQRLANGARSDARPERREYHLRLNREMRYWVRFRAIRRAADEAAYLAHNAAVHGAWYRENREHVAQWKAASLSNKLAAVRACAEQRGILWELTEEQAIALILADCTYCGCVSKLGAFGGIDRVNNSRCYDATGNCVPACITCNDMKACLDVVTFLQRVSHLAAVAVGGPHEMYPDAWEFRRPSPYLRHKANAENKGLTWELTREEFDAIQAQDCTVCLRAGPSSVDRTNNGPVYRAGRVLPFCVECNYMKKNLDDHVFLAHVVKIANHGALARMDSTCIPRQRMSIFHGTKSQSF